MIYKLQSLLNSLVDLLLTLNLNLLHCKDKQMAKVASHKLTAKAPADTDVAAIRFYIDGNSTPDFIGQASVGVWPSDAAHMRRVPAVAGATVETVFNAGDLVDGTYSFAAQSEDASGNLSDAVTKAEWTNVPLDLTAPGAPTDLTIETL
jgi:hypothetical protein